MTYKDSGLYKAMLSAAFEQGRKDFTIKLWQSYLMAYEDYGHTAAAKDFLKEWGDLDEEVTLKKIRSFNVAEEATEDFIKVFDEPEAVGYTQPRVWQFTFAIRRAINDGRLAGWREVLQDAKRILKHR